MRLIIFIFTILLQLILYSKAPNSTFGNTTIEYKFPDGKRILLLNKKDGQKAILEDENDPYFSNLTNIDIAIRMKTTLESDNLEANRRKFKEHTRKAVVDWTPEEARFMLKVLKKAYTLCNKITPNLIPNKWQFIKTNGSEESNLYYTRENCTFIPMKHLKKITRKYYFYSFLKTMIHETFHVYSRLNPDKKRELYKLIGFTKKGSVQLCDYLAKRKLSNPDGMDYSYQITIQTPDNRTIQAIPVIYSKYEEYQPKITYLFTYVQLGLFEVQLKNGIWKTVTDQNGIPKAYKPKGVKGFYEQIGRNTKYIIHPDEIMADNVSLLVRLNGLKLKWTGDEEGKKLINRIKKVLKSD